MPGQHKHNPIPFRPPEGDRARLLAYAGRTGQPVNRVLAAALAAYLDAACPHCGCDPRDETTLGTHAGAACPLPECLCSEGDAVWGTYYPDPYNPHEAQP